MQTLQKHRNLLFLAASVAVLAGCGSEEIASPGSGGNVTVNITTPPPPPPPPPPTSTLVTPASGCPTIDDPQGLRDLGTISGRPVRIAIANCLPESTRASTCRAWGDSFTPSVAALTSVSTEVRRLAPAKGRRPTIVASC